MNFGPPAVAGLHYIRVIPELELEIFGPVSVFGGLNLGYLAVESVVDKETSISLGENLDFTKSTDVGVLGGVNINIAGLNLSLKYNYGLRDINSLKWTDHDGWIVDNIAFKNRFLQIGIGYRIDFKI
jgi:hypothetical protein